MITESLIRKKFVHQTIRASMTRLHEAWRPAARAFQVRSDELRSFTDHPMPLMQIESGRYSVHYFLPLHLRFLDIQYRRKKAKRGEGERNLYNKIVWPILYKQMLPELRHGFTDEVRSQIRQRFEKAVKT